MADGGTNPLLNALNRSVPFARHANVEVTAADLSGATARLHDAPFLLNHVGSQHAGALFTLGEAASGAAMTAAFADLLGSALPLVRQASIQYRKVARGPIEASARLSKDPAAIRADFIDFGKADFDVVVTLHDTEENEVATMTVEWSLRRRGN